MLGVQKSYRNIYCVASNGLIPRVLGSVSSVHVHSQSRGKLDPRAIQCVFVGYSSTHFFNFRRSYSFVGFYVDDIIVTGMT